MSYKATSVIINMIWRFLERIAAQGVAFVVSLILARMLNPEIYGLIAIVTVFTSILQVFVDSGMATALIQKKDSDDVDYSSVFYFNVVTSLFLYGVLYLLAPFIASFYNNQELTVIVRVLSLTLVVSGVKNVQQAYVAKHMQFKRFFYATFAGTVCAAIVGITMAYQGAGVWALVAQHLVNLVVDTLVLWVVVKWRPKLVFSWRRLTKLLGFGWKILASKIIDAIYTNLRTLIIGKKYNTEDLAFYNRGEIFPVTIVANVNTSIDSILLPTMSNEQDNTDRIRSMTRRAIKTSTYIMAPMMLGLFVVAEPLVSLILTEKWMPCVPYMRIFCLTYMFYPIHTSNLNAIKAMGRSDLFLKLEVAKKIVGITTLLLTMQYGVMVMAYSLLVTSVMNQMINSWPNRKLLNYKYIEQLRDILPNILLATVMGICAYCVTCIKLSDVITLCLQVVVGVLVYIGGSRVFKIESFEYLLEIIRPNMNKLLKQKQKG